MPLEQLRLANYMRLCMKFRAVEDIINKNSADGGKHPNYIQLLQKKRQREIVSSNNKCLII